MKVLRACLLIFLLAFTAVPLTACQSGGDKIEDIFGQIPGFVDSKIDYEGKDFHIMVWGSGDKPKAEDAGSDKLSIAKIQQEIAKRNNIGEIVWDTVGDWMAVQSGLTAKVMANNAPDIALLVMNWYFPSVTNNLIAEVPDAQKIIDGSILYHDKVSLGYKDNGKYYGLFDDHYIIASEGICYNKDLMKKYSLEDPAKLFMEDKWDFDTFLKYCETLSKDTDNDGSIDQYGYGCPGVMDGRADALNFLSANGAEMLIEKDNKFEVGLDGSNALGGLNLIKKIIFDNSYADIELSMDFTRVTGLFKNQKIAMMGMCAWGVGMAENFSAGFVGYPKGPDAGNNYYLWNESPTIVAVPNGSNSSKRQTDALKVYEQVRLSGKYIMEWVNQDGTGLDKDVLDSVKAELAVPEAKNKIALTESVLKEWAGNEISEYSYPAIRKTIASQRFAPFEGSNDFRHYGKSIFTDIAFGDYDPEGSLKVHNPDFQAIIDRDVNELIAKFENR